MIRFLVLAVLLSASGASAEQLWPELSAAKPIGGGEKDAAVVVGAEQYVFVEHVPGARRNADDWQAYLTESLRVPSDRVSLIRDNEATLELMREKAREAASSVEPGGTLWFVFIGHGAPSKDGKDGVLVGVDAQQRADSLYARSLPRGELLSLLSKGQQAKTVVLLDACFSGRSSTGGALVKGLQPLIVSRARPEVADGRTILLTAARSDQFAGPLPKAEKPRPAFSYLALGALRGWAADAEGKVTASALVRFVEKALKLSKDRTQTPELSAGDGGAVLGLGHERAPDLAKIDREGSADESGGGLFQVSNLPAVPAVQAPAAVDFGAAGLDFRSADIEALKKYDNAVEIDQDPLGAPDKKAIVWRDLAKEAPKFASVATKRAEAWELFFKQQEEAEAAKQARIDARDSDWAKLSQLLALKVVASADKRRWAGQFTSAYLSAPGLEPECAKALEPFLPAGPTKVAVKALALKAPSTPAVPKRKIGQAGIEWIRIPGGTFKIGDYGNGGYNAGPEVTVKTFEMSKSEVTRKQWNACVAAGACTAPHDCTLASGVTADDYPVTCVDWDQAHAFATWVGGSLPSEAQWEYAARSAGRNYKYPWGNDEVTCERAIFCESKPGQSGCTNGCGRDTFWPVCSKPKGDTEQGICDMAGNVLEMIEDYYHPNYQGAPTDGSAWLVPQTANRIMRGGVWHLWASNTETTYRAEYNTVYSGGGYLGVRVVRPAR